MNFRLTAVLLGAVLVLGLVLLGVTWLDDAPAPTDLALEDLAGVKADQIDVVEIARGSGPPLKLVRLDKDRWEVREPFKARADRFAVEGVVAALLRAKPVASPELTDNLAVHGLDNPGLKVTLRRGTEKAATLNVGEVTGGGDKGLAFVTTDARPARPMAVRRSDVEPLLKPTASKAGGPAGDMAKGPADFRTKALFPQDAGPDVAQGIRLTARGKQLELSRVADGWKFTSPALGEADTAGDTTAKDGVFTGVRPLLTALTNLQATSADDFIEAPGDLKPYGLDASNPDLVRVEIRPRNGPPEAVLVGKTVDGQPGRVYVKAEAEAGVVKAQGPDLAGLAAAVENPDALRDRTLVAADKARIDAIDLTVPGSPPVKLRKAGTPPAWTLYGGPGDPQPANPAAVDALVTALAERRNVKAFPPPNDAAFAGPEVKAEVKLWADGVEPEPKPDPKAEPKADPKAEPKLKGTPTSLTLGSKLGDAVFLRRALADGAKLDVLMPEKFLAAVARPRLDYLSPSLKSFSPDRVSKVSFNRGPELFEVVRDETPDPKRPGARWVFAAPPGLKGLAADAAKVSGAVGLLPTQTVGRFVSEQPTDAELAKWGLDPKAPRMRVTVALNEPADPVRVYEFGTEADDKDQVYARQGGRPAVFTVPKFLYERFATTDFRDPVFLRVDPATVTGLSFRGWKGVTGGVFTLDLEKKDGTWAAKAPPGFAVDPLKVDRLLKALEAVRAKAFVGAATPQNKFDLESADGFHIEVRREGRPSFVLVLGGEADNGQSYYALCTAGPNEVVTVDAAPFKPFREKPAAFQK